jgi:1,4-dihydroxy-2-naphthoate polyprenyltransferase
MYHTLLLAFGWAFATIFMMEQQGSLLRFLFVLSLPLFLNNMVAVRVKTSALELDPYLKQLAISTLIFVILFGVGLLIS